MRKKPKIKYTDMCIWVDNNIKRKDLADSEIEQAYEYLRMIAYMLACKRRFFGSETDYDNFSHYMATFVYNRMTTHKQFLNKDDPEYIEPIKSCLNYMKQTLFARKCDYCTFEYNFNIKDVLTDEDMKNSVIDSAKKDMHGLLQCDIESYLSTIHHIVYNEIYNGVYGKNKVLAWKLYTAVLLSLLRNFTLSNENKRRLGIVDEEITDDSIKNNYEEKFSQLMQEENETATITYDLPNIYKDYIYVILQKVKAQMIEDITGLSSYYEVSDSMVEDILALNVGDSNE